MTENTLSDGSSGGTTKIAKSTVQDMYLMRALDAIRTFDLSLANLSGVTDQRPVYCARQCVNRVIDDPIRHELLRKFDQKIAEITASTSDNEKKSHLVRLAAIDIVGEVNSYFDEFLNIHRQNVLGDA